MRSSLSESAENSFDFETAINAPAYRELNLKKGDLVYIFKKIDRNWYEGECLGRTGIFPVR